MVCLAGLALLAGSALADDDARDPAAAATPAAAESKDAEIMEVAESSNNNTAAADEDASPERSNTKRTIDHNLGYGYRYNTVLRPVVPGHPLGPLAHPMHHYLTQGRRPTALHGALPMYKLQSLQSLQPRYPHHYFTSSASGGGASGTTGGAPFRYSQPLPSPPQRDEPSEAMTPMAPRPVTESPSGPHADSLALYRQQLQQQLQQQHSEQSGFSFEDDMTKAKPEVEQAEPQPVQYADDAAAQSYQHVLQAEPTYILAPAATAPGAGVLGASPLAAMYGHSVHHMHSVGHAGAAHPVVYSAAHGGPHAAATQMIPVIIVRLMDSQTAAASLTPSTTLGHAMTHMAHAVPYPLVNMQFLRDYISKLYASSGPSAAAAAAQHQYVSAAEPAESVVYTSPLYSSAQLQKLQMQQHLHAQLQKQLQMQVQHQQHHQQQRQSAPSVAALLQEQHRQRVAAAAAQHSSHAAHQGRTEVTVHRSPAMSPQDYKESVEQQEEA